MADILEEVLRDHSDEKKLRHLRKILPIILSIAAIVIAVMVYSNWQQDRNLANKRRVGDKFFEILARNPEIDKKSFADLEQVKNERNINIAKLASLRQIDVQLKNFDYASAKVLLEKIMLNDDYDEITKAYAYLSWLGIVIENPNPDDGVNFQQNSSFFDEDKEYPFKGTINLLQAQWYIKNDQKTAARESLQKILKLEYASSAAKEQAKALMANLQ